jgi:hypothetical protein
MNKVDFTLKNGRIERMHPKIAELLQRKGKGTYQTRVLEQAPQRAVLVPEQPRMLTAEEDQVMREAVKSSGVVVHPGKLAEEPSVAATPEPVDLASMSVEELREHAKRQGVQVHHRAGAKTVIDALKKAEE